MKLEHVLLGMVAMRPCTGYDLKRWLDSEMGRMVRLRTQQSQVYRTLNRMCADGWVSFTVQHNEGRPDAKVYVATDAGERELRDRLAVPYAPSPDFSDPEFLIRCTLAIFLEPEEHVRLVQIELDARRAQLDRFRAREIREEPWLSGIDRARMSQILDHVHDYKDRALETHVRWLEQVLAELAGTSH
ncbi:PadR family transcriptional regulator [Streptomyces sp. NBC_00075]|uniref:PadR family transcriptional regulator n=1 Tax=Streptomyces sp. NBC_00075 TaxID=2975641 RepID=UPI00324DB4D6